MQAETKTRADIEDKQRQLRQLVGNSYRQNIKPDESLTYFAMN